jgi:hypothetical protein
MEAPLPLDTVVRTKISAISRPAKIWRATRSQTPVARTQKGY